MDEIETLEKLEKQKRVSKIWAIFLMITGALCLTIYIFDQLTIFDLQGNVFLAFGIMHLFLATNNMILLSHICVKILLLYGERPNE
jgi:hypothetical protein